MRDPAEHLDIDGGPAARLQAGDGRRRVSGRLPEVGLPPAALTLGEGGEGAESKRYEYN